MSICWPDGLSDYSNTTVSAPVISLDILPTVLDAAGIEPLNGFEAFDGRSWLPLIRGETNRIHESLCWSEGGETGEYSIRQGDWKLYIDENVYELYNLAADIGETNDLSDVYPEQVRAMRQDFFAWMTEMTDAAGDDLDSRLWSITVPPVSGASAVELHSVELSDGMLEVEYDEKAGWLTNGPVFESSASLTNGWTSVVPDTMEQLDRYLDFGTYRAGFSTDEPEKFIRIQGTVP
jgi:hypothetical protein